MKNRQELTVKNIRINDFVDKFKSFIYKMFCVCDEENIAATLMQTATKQSNMNTVTCDCMRLQSNIYGCLCLIFELDLGTNFGKTAMN